MIFAISFYVHDLQIGGFQVPSASALIIIGIIICLIILFLERRRLGLLTSATVMIFMLYFIGDSLISRGLFALSHIFLHHDFMSQLRIYYFFPVSGKVLFGSLVSAVIAPFIAAAALKEKDKRYQYLDMFMVSYVMLIIFVRIGNFLVHFHSGKLTNLPWGFDYMGQVRHEPSLYEAISLTILFIICWIARTRIKKPGALSLFIIGWIALSRFITDFTRSNDLADSNFHFGNGLISLNQVVYLAVLGIIFSIYYRQRRNIVPSVTN